MTRWHTTASGYRNVSLALAMLGLLALWYADIDIQHGSPGNELKRMASGFIHPDFFSTSGTLTALANTVAFALQGTALAIGGGLLLALFWHWRLVRIWCAISRSIHELFWGLLFIQLFGLSSLAGVLAIGIPYMGICAKVFGELLEEADRQPLRALAHDSGALSLLLYVRLPLVWQQICSYSRYRFECAIRASAILGFIGLPTLGFHLESAFRQGLYAAGAALLYLLLLTIVSQRSWGHARLLPLLFVLALWWSPPLSHINIDTAWQLLSDDFIPAPLRQGEGLSGLYYWCTELLWSQGLPGILATVLLSSSALLITALLALLMIPSVTPMYSPSLYQQLRQRLAQFTLTTLRSTPEFLLAFLFLLLLGPSMLPGILALALHTSAIVAHLCGRFSVALPNRDDLPADLSHYFWDRLPRLYPNFLAVLLYRWEVIMRETAILGILGIHTLGFYVDSAFAEFRFDRALLFIALGVLLNLAVDHISRQLRQRLRLSHRTTMQPMESAT